LKKSAVVSRSGGGSVGAVRVFPKPFWRAAAKLARKHRPGRVAHALGIDYYCLKKRLDSAKENSASAPQAKAALVELLPSVPAPDRECTFELEDPRGPR